jgi:hypothetical protein
VASFGVFRQFRELNRHVGQMLLKGGIRCFLRRSAYATGLLAGLLRWMAPSRGLFAKIGFSTTPTDASHPRDVRDRGFESHFLPAGHGAAADDRCRDRSRIGSRPRPVPNCVMIRSCNTAVARGDVDVLVLVDVPAVTLRSDVIMPGRNIAIEYAAVATAPA